MVKKTIENFVILLCLVLVIVNIVQVLLRYIFGTSLVCSEELARYTMIWMAFLGAGLLGLDRGHSKISLIMKMKHWKIPYLLVESVSVIVLLIIIVAGIKISIQSWSQPLPTLPISAGMAYLALPIGMLILLFAVVRQMMGMGKDSE